jgi:hypothetical protein
MMSKGQGLLNLERSTLFVSTNLMPKYTYTFNGRKDSSGDYIVRCYKDGKRYPDGDYFTPDKDDAIATKTELERRANEGIESAGNRIKE